MSLKEFSLAGTSPTESAKKWEREVKKTQTRADKLFADVEMDE